MDSFPPSGDSFSASAYPFAEVAIPSTSGTSPPWPPAPTSPSLASMFNTTVPDYFCLSPAPSTRPASRLRDSRREWIVKRGKRTSSTFNSIIKVEDEELIINDTMQSEQDNQGQEQQNPHDETGSITLVPDPVPDKSISLPTRAFAEAFRHVRRLNELLKDDPSLRVLVTDLQSVNLALLKAQEGLVFPKKRKFCDI